MSSAIEVNGVSKRFGKKEVLSNVHLDVEHGQIFGLIGPSGSGKTTLIKLIVGMDHPSEGTIKVLNTAVPNLEILQRLGYMAQSDALYPELTGKENLHFFASLFLLKKGAAKTAD